MPPKQRITREMILERSFAMFCQEGMGIVNARSVAKALNCSTQPIFSYYAGMDDLKNALNAKAQETFEACMLAAHKADAGAVSACSAYIGFAGEQPRLFAHLFMHNNENQALSSVTMKEMEKSIVEAESKACGVDEAAAYHVCRQMWLFSHGLASVIAAGKVTYTQEEMVGLLRGVYAKITA